MEMVIIFLKSYSLTNIKVVSKLDFWLNTFVKDVAKNVKIAEKLCKQGF